jgi:hydroxymethylpyrimidine pyrophosphatase-like HAD family hydrolase
VRAASNGSDLRKPLGGRPRISVFATDLDRTLLRPGGKPSETARAALREARAMGLRTLLVSGREYSKLGRFARAIGEWDGIVAENGAVVEVPTGSTPRIVGLREAARVRRRLRDRPDLHCEFGQVVISVPRAHRLGLLDALSGLPVRIIPNVDQLMVLPEGVTKMSGIRIALRQLDLSHAGYAAIGDAENDLEMLGGASLAGAVANAEPGVRSAADYVCRGRFERGVLEFVRGPLRDRMEQDPMPLT